MTLNRAMELLQIEHDCINKSNSCDRQCGSCELVQDADELLEMYQYVLDLFGNHIIKRSERTIKNYMVGVPPEDATGW